MTARLAGSVEACKNPDFLGFIGSTFLSLSSGFVSLSTLSRNSFRLSAKSDISKKRIQTKISVLLLNKQSILVGSV